MTRILLRPLRLETWRELAFVLLGGVMSVVAFCVQVAGLSAGLSLLVTLIGIPILAALAYVDRWLCGIDRWRASFLLGEPVRGVYRTPERPGILARLRVLAVDPQTWRDLGWIWLNIVLGFVAAVLMLTLWLVVGWLVTFPVYWWLLPDSALPDGPWGLTDTWGEALAGAAIGMVLAPLVAWIGAGVARGLALAARFLLGPSERRRLEHRVGELARTRAAAVDAQADELRRIERDLHDGAQARMVAVTMDLGRAREKLDSDPEAARELVEAAHTEARTAIADLRRLVAGIAPAVLTDRGLDAALSALVASCRVPVSLDVRLEERLPTAVEVAAYFVVSEALVNVQKHAEAQHARVHLRLQEESLVVEVVDDGRGGADLEAGTGLPGLRDRVAALDGTLVVTSPRGGPTIVRAEIPCAS
jgi:signal transduction histidine kinase